ncbi:MAG TPA: lipopolysaccharide heptosyltransferase II [Gammaproteobacteria bacterium]|jgi:heptosyltransferase-2|nr:lipopolysaccharide heptosyltransferase II [Gammaproteobacteria bacterium]
MSKKILIIGPAWVGDMVMAQSLFTLLKQANPTDALFVLASPWTFALLSRMPEVEKAIPLPIAHGEFGLIKRYQIAKALRAERFDHAIVLPNSFKSALIPWFARIPKRTGWVGECRQLLLNDARPLDEKRYPLMVQRWVALGLAKDAVLPDYSYPALQVSQATQQATLAKHQLTCTDQPILALGAGAEFGPAKRWPANYYAAVAKQKIKEGWRVWLFGSPNDRAITDEIMVLTDHQCENLAGKLVLDETIDLLSLVSGLVTNDSGLMHMGAALQKPIVAIYGSTSPAFTPPLGNATVLKLNLDCQPCLKRTCPLGHYRCLYDLPPQRVLEAMQTWGV